MIKLVVNTPKGEIANFNCPYLTVDGDYGQIGIYPNHVPIIMKITSSYIETEVQEKLFETTFIVVINGILDFNDNIATVVAQDASISNNLEDAFKIIEENKKRILNENKRKTVDFVQAEKELAKNIKESKASKI